MDENIFLLIDNVVLKPCTGVSADGDALIRLSECNMAAYSHIKSLFQATSF